MSVPPAASPFVPGRGGLPPYLAGRDNEQHTLKRLPAYLEHGRDAPILLELADTPGLQAHLNTISATFWNRAGPIGVGRLDVEATSAALMTGA